MTDEICALTAVELAKALHDRVIRPREAVEAVFERIAAVDGDVHAFVTLDGAGALEAADRAERDLLAGAPVGPLHGVPVSVKDVLATKGLRTTRGSAVFADHVPSADSPVVDLLRHAGAVIVGKTTTPEFGHKAVTDSALTAPTANPWDVARTAGGSSGGAAAAVAAGMGPLAVGTDGGGSIRVPAALCGVFGLKPTTGLVPTYPPSRLGPLGHTGPIARTVTDAALLLDVLTGQQNREAADARAGGVTALRVGVYRTIGQLPVEPGVTAAVDATATLLGRLGAHVSHVTLAFPGFEEVWDVLFGAGMLAETAQLPPDSHELLTPSFRDVLTRARARPAGAAERAELRRVGIVQRIASLLHDFDVLVGPTVAVPAFPLGADGPTTIAGEDVDPAAWWRLTQLWNLGGQPAAAIPAGLVDGLPTSVHVAAARGRDDLVLRTAAAIEDAVPRYVPPLLDQRAAS